MRAVREDRGAPNMVVWMLRLSSDQRRHRRAEGGVMNILVDKEELTLLRDENAALRAIVARVEDVEGIRVYIKNERCLGDIDDPFISYQEAKISKGKLCEIIAKSIRTWLKEG